MTSNQKYFPIATIDNENELRLVEYNHGVENLAANINRPHKASFAVQNAKGSVDFPRFEGAIEEKLNELFRCRGSCDITLVEYLEGEIKALFGTAEMNNISSNGSTDWIPLDTQSVINMYPDYNKKMVKPSSLNGVSHPGSSNQANSAAKLSLVPINGSSVYDWRLAHLEEAFNSFSSNNQAHFNIRKEGVVVISVVREWLVSHKIRGFMHSIFTLIQILRSKNPSETKTIFWCLGQFKSIFDGFRHARTIYEGLAKYKEHFREIYFDHEAQMSGHLDALEGHLAVILDPSLEPNSQTMEERVLELSELLRLCSKALMEFTVALQRKLAFIAASKDTAHQKMVGNAVMAAVSVGVAIYARPTRLAARAAHFAAVAGSCGIAYYFYKLEKELESLKLEQEMAIQISASMITCIRKHSQSFSDGLRNPFERPQAELLASLSHVHFVSLQDDLHDLRKKLEQLAKPTPQPSASRYIGWW